MLRTYSTNQPQHKWYTHVTCVCAMCAQAKKLWHLIIRVHVCKINTPHTRTYPYEVSAMKQSSLQPVVLALYNLRMYIEIFLVEWLPIY